jgi:AMP deaminase
LHPKYKTSKILPQVFDLSSVDICEIARNSVLQSGFEDILKSYWIGGKYKEDSDEANGRKT